MFRIYAAFNGMTTEIYVLLSEWQFLSCRHRDLGFDDIYTGNHFGDGMFYLYPGIHLDEKKLSFFIEKLERAGTAVTDLAACVGTAFPYSDSLLRRDQWSRCFLNDLLMASLHRAIAITEVDGIAVLIS